MKENRVILRGVITTKKELLIYGLNDLSKFKDQAIENSNEDVDLLINITKLPKKGKEKRIGYIYGKIIPDFKEEFKKNGLRLTTKSTKDKVLNLTTVCRNRQIEDLNFYELGDMIDELKQIAAEDFNFYIDDSVVL